MRGLVRLGALLIPSTPVIRRLKVTALSPALSQSNLLALRGVSGRARAAITSATAPTGTFTRNSHGQEATERIRAAIVGPAAEARATTRAFLPSPRPSMACG